MLSTLRPIPSRTAGSHASSGSTSAGGQSPALTVGSHAASVSTFAGGQYCRVHSTATQFCSPALHWHVTQVCPPALHVQPQHPAPELHTPEAPATAAGTSRRPMHTPLVISSSQLSVGAATSAYPIRKSSGLQSSLAGQPTGGRVPPPAASSPESVSTSNAKPLAEDLRPKRRLFWPRYFPLIVCSSCVSSLTAFTDLQSHEELQAEPQVLH